MNSGEQPRGYTVVEVLIFLAVTSALFVTIAITWSGRQAKTEFGTAVREMESRLQDIVNDVSTGYYANPGNFSCNVVSGAPTFSDTPSEQGTNDECIFFGRVTHFDINGTGGEKYNVYTVAGARQYTTASGEKREVTNFFQAQPRVIRDPVDITERLDMPPGLRVANMYYDDGAGKVRIYAVGFFSSLAAYTSEGLQPGTINVNVLPITTTSGSEGNVVNRTNNISNSYADATQNPSGGVVVCMNGTAVNQHAELKIGGGGRQLTTDVTTRDGSCPSV